MSKILVIEQNYELRIFLERILRRGGHKVTAVQFKKEAERQLQRSIFDFLMADIGSDGDESVALAESARLNNPDLHVVLITGFAGIACGGTIDGIKPFHLRQVAEVVSQLSRAAP